MRDTRPNESRGHRPFSRDVRAIGHYQYTGPNAPASATLATGRQTEMILLELRKIAPSRVIDVGCGDGRLTAKIAEMSGSILGVDPSKEAIEAAKSQVDLPQNVHFTNTTLEEMKATAKRFDVAILRGVLHHADDPKALLVDVAALAHRIIVVEQNGMNPALKIIEKVSPYHRTHGERSFSSWRIKRWMTQAGYRVESGRVGVLIPYFAPDWSLRVLSRVEPVSESLPIIRWLLCGTQVLTGVKTG